MDAVMPDHVHGTLWIVDTDGGARHAVRLRSNNSANLYPGPFLRSFAPSNLP